MKKTKKNEKSESNFKLSDLGESMPIQLVVIWLDAARTGDNATMRAIHASCPKILNATLATGDIASALGTAVSAGQVETVKLLVEWGADAEVRGPLLQWPLIIAMGAGDWGMVEALLPAATGRERAHDGSTALMMATTRFGPDSGGELHAEQWRALAEKSQLLATDRDGFTALRVAAMFTNAMAIETLLPMTLEKAKDAGCEREAWESACAPAFKLGRHKSLDIMMHHRASEPWRDETLDKIESLIAKGKFSASQSSLPATFALMEARQLRRAIAEGVAAAKAASAANEKEGLGSGSEGEPHKRAARRV